MFTNPYKPPSAPGYGYQPSAYPSQAGGYPSQGYPSQAGGYPMYPGMQPGTMSPGGAAGAGGGYPPAGAQTQTTGGQGGVNVPGQLPIEESYIENILRLNLGKIATIYMTFENNTQWNAKVFRGRVEAAGRDHIIISDTQTGMRYLLLMVNLDYVTFEEELNYYYPYATGGAPGPGPGAGPGPGGAGGPGGLGGVGGAGGAGGPGGPGGTGRR